MQRAAKRHATGRTLSFGSVLLLGINGIIGSGIFLLPGTLYQQSGKWSVLALIAAGLVTTMIALCYAAMASKIDDDGGAWVYADRAFGRFLGFQTGWFGWFLGVITIAAEIAAFLTTLGGLVPAVKTRPVYLAVAMGILAILAILNLVGSSLLTLIDNLSSVLKIGIIVVFVGAAGFFISQHSFELPSAGSNGGGFSQSFAATFYMYTGFSFLPVAAKKMANPEKTLPRAFAGLADRDGDRDGRVYADGSGHDGDSWRGTERKRAAGRECIRHSGRHLGKNRCATGHVGVDSRRRHCCFL